MVFLLLAACSDGTLDGFGSVTGAVYIRAEKEDGTVSAYAQGRSPDARCSPSDLEPAGPASAEEVAGLCAVLEEVILKGSNIAGASPTFDVWSAWWAVDGGTTGAESG